MKKQILLGAILLFTGGLFAQSPLAQTSDDCCALPQISECFGCEITQQPWEIMGVEGENQSTIDQSDANNHAMVNQNGDGNYSSVTQKDTYFGIGYNFAMVDQTGLFNSAVISQDGLFELHFVKQNGQGNFAKVTTGDGAMTGVSGSSIMQYGNWNAAFQTQLVGFNAAKAFQNGESNYAEQNQSGSTSFSWFANLAKIHQKGYYNEALQNQTVHKYGSNNARSQQYGYGNSSVETQDAYGGHNRSGIHQSSWDDSFDEGITNKACVTQIAYKRSKNKSMIDQTGSNRAYVYQEAHYGAKNLSGVNQNGYRNSAKVNQYAENRKSMNDSDIIQDGEGNWANVSQNATVHGDNETKNLSDIVQDNAGYNSAYLSQMASNDGINDSEIYQHGGGTANVSQNATHWQFNKSYVKQYEGMDNWACVSQSGDNGENYSEITQTGDYNFAGVTQYSDFFVNNSSITQTGNWNYSCVDQTAMTGDNSSVVSQIGNGNSAVVTQLNGVTLN